MADILLMSRRGYVQEGICTGGDMYRRGYVQEGICTGGDMYRRGYVQEGNVKIDCNDKTKTIIIFKID